MAESFHRQMRAFDGFLIHQHFCALDDVERYRANPEGPGKVKLPVLPCLPENRIGPVEFSKDQNIGLPSIRHIPAQRTGLRRSRVRTLKLEPE